jgi:hypothetical protein
MGGLEVMAKPDGLLLSADAAREKLAMAEAEKASKAARLLAKAEAEKKSLLDQLSKPTGVSEDEAIRRASRIIERAIANGLSEVQVHRFPNELCTDKGRAINQQEVGWEKTLTGKPAEIYNFWYKHLRPLGYKLQVEIVDFPNGMPGDVGMKLKWA